MIFYQSIDNQPAGRVWSFRDLTERRKREVELIQNRSFLKTIVKNAPVGIMVVDQDGKPIEINEQLLFMFQTDKKTFYNDTKFELILPIGDQLKETIKKIVEGKINSYRIVKEILKYDGTFFWGDISVSPIYDYNGKLSKIIAIFIDITKRKEMEIKLRNMAIIDPLTQLPNRRFFQSTVEKSIKRGDRKDSLVAILFLDLDGFKQINDKFGHEAGDKVLQKVAKRLKKSVREYDLVARIGGDEFTIILEDIENKKGIEIMAKRIIDMVSIPYELDENTGKVTVSIGISIFPKDDQNSTALIQKADEAMYVAKNMGKNRYVFYEELKR